MDPTATSKILKGPVFFFRVRSEVTIILPESSS